MNPRNLYEQMDDGAKHALALLVGVDSEGPAFRCYTRDVPPLPDGFTVGDAARAYLQYRLTALRAEA